MKKVRGAQIYQPPFGQSVNKNARFVAIGKYGLILNKSPDRIHASDLDTEGTGGRWAFF